jgi:hypothetical protein
MRWRWKKGMERVDSEQERSETMNYFQNRVSVWRRTLEDLDGLRWRRHCELLREGGGGGGEGGGGREESATGEGGGGRGGDRAVSGGTGGAGGPICALRLASYSLHDSVMMVYEVDAKRGIARVTESALCTTRVKRAEGEVGSGAGSKVGTTDSSANKIY